MMDVRDKPFWQLSYEERMERRRLRLEADPEYQARRAARIERLQRSNRHREIWSAIRAYDRAKAEARVRRSPAQAKELRRR